MTHTYLLYESNFLSVLEIYSFVLFVGFSAVAAIILLEMAASGEPLNSITLTAEEVRVAAENYAIAALSMS